MMTYRKGGSELELIKMTISKDVHFAQNDGFDGYDVEHFQTRENRSDGNQQKIVPVVNNEKPGLQNILNEIDLANSNIITQAVVISRTWIQQILASHKTLLTRIFITALFILYWIYFGFAIANDWHKAVDYCDGAKFLFILTAIVSLFLIYFQIVIRFFGPWLNKQLVAPVATLWDKLWNIKWIRWATYLLLIGGLITFLVIDSKDNRERLVSVSGIVILILLGFIFSKYPSRIRWRHVFWGLALQFIMALFVLRWSVGEGVFQCLGSKVQSFLEYTNDGSSFVFGYLVTGVLNGIANVTIGNVTIESISLPPQQQIFGFQVLSVLYFFSFCVSILFYYGIMQWIVGKMGWLLQATIGTTACESINAAGCIFVGQTEAPLMIRPYLPLMTKSEIHAVMAGGFANVAGSTLAAYISFGVSPSHLLSATLMSAPAALGYSKLMYPETEESKTTSDDIKIEKGEERNALEAAANGASTAIILVLNIIANLISFISFIYFLNAVLSWLGELVGWEFITFEWLMGKLFTPFAFILGVDWEECGKVGQLIGTKTIINEFVAYAKLGQMIKNGELSNRASTIATYALCSFSNFSSIGIQLGCLGGMAPERKQDIAQVAFRAFVSGSAACLLTACVAGSLLQ